MPSIESFKSSQTIMTIFGFFSASATNTDPMAKNKNGITFFINVIVVYRLYLTKFLMAK